MTDDMHEARELPHVIAADEAAEPLADLAENRRALLRELLARHGAVLLRGFRVDGLEDFGRFAEAFSNGPLINYSERSSPRTSLAGAIYTSTDYPPDETIFLHNENSYQASWPRTLYFHCVQPPATLGATPLADIRRVYGSIEPEVRAEFERRGWSVVRNFHPGFGVSWQYVFGTEDRSTVAEYCHAHEIEHTWIGAGQLRTRATRKPVHVHPGTGKPVWFNHIAFFHHTTLPEEVREGVMALFEPDDLPTDTRYGDGVVIPDDVVAHLRDCYERHRVRFDWQAGDVLLVDNMLVAHGREPFTGHREIAVAMTDPYRPH